MKTQITALSLLTLLMFGFQNCSDVAFEQSTDALSTTKTTDGLSPEDNIEPIPVEAPETELVSECDDDLEEVVAEEDSEDEADDSDSNEPFPKQATMLAAGSSLDHIRGSFFFSSPSMKTVEDFRGKLKIESGNIDTVYNGRGSLRLIASVNNSVVKSMEDLRGNTRVCGHDVGSLFNYRGNLLIKDGKLTDLEDFRGNVVVINGSIGDITNFRGSIRLINSKILGSQSDVQASIREN